MCFVIRIWSSFFSGRQKLSIEILILENHDSFMEKLWLEHQGKDFNNAVHGDWEMGTNFKTVIDRDIFFNNLISVTQKFHKFFSPTKTNFWTIWLKNISETWIFCLNLIFLLNFALFSFKNNAKSKTSCKNSTQQKILPRLDAYLKQTLFEKNSHTKIAQKASNLTEIVTQNWSYIVPDTKNIKYFKKLQMLWFWKEWRILVVVPI